MRVPPLQDRFEEMNFHDCFFVDLHHLRGLSRCCRFPVIRRKHICHLMASVLINLYILSILTVQLNYKKHSKPETPESLQQGALRL